MYMHSWRPLETCPWDLPVSRTKLFSGKKYWRLLSSSAGLSDAGLKEYCYTMKKCKMVSCSRVAAGNKKQQSSDKIKTLYPALCSEQLGSPPALLSVPPDTQVT